MKLTWYGHSAFRIEVSAAKILIDPFLSDNSSWKKGGGRNPPRVSRMCCSRTATTITSATRSPS
jgi:L-ascorbate metabolism protein UlaG (beta-lactamase superfamily)